MALGKSALPSSFRIPTDKLGNGATCASLPSCSMMDCKGRLDVPLIGVKWGMLFTATAWSAYNVIGRASAYKRVGIRGRGEG